MSDYSSCLNADGSDTLLRVKAVPGARSDQVVGLLGDRLKIRVAAPPEGGQANRAICALLAASLGIKPGAIQVERGQTSAEKTLRIAGVPADRVAKSLADA